MAYVLMAVLFLVALMLILLVLVQRGKGGGLAGAFGGMGGQSAFGTKAGDLFTKVTIVVASLWIILCMITVKYFGAGQDILDRDLGGNAAEQREGLAAPLTTEGAPGGDSAPAPEDGPSQ